MERKYNFIYRELVNGKDDMVGHVAYSLYKANKIQFIEDFKKKHNEQDPTDYDFEKFHEMSCLPDSIENYKRSAVDLLKSFLNESLSEAVNQIEIDSMKRHRKMLEDIVSDMKPKRSSWWKNLGLSILSTFIIMVVICVISFLFSLSNKGFQIVMKGDGSVNMEQVHQPNSK